MSLSLLTARELDVVSCLLNGRGVKKTASLLKISPKTVETHIRNLMLKTNCTSREHLIDQIVEANMLQSVQQHYTKILGKDFSPTIQSNELIHQNSSKKSSISLVWFAAFLSILVCLFLVKFLFFHEKSTIKDDLLLPNKLAFLERQNLLKEIKHQFSKSHDGVKTVALKGVAGAGKTIIARSYAKQYHEGLIWEICASSKESILISFEKLLIAMLQKERDTSGYQSLQKIRNTPQYESTLLQMLKEKLSLNPDWLLIFDNVTDTKNIQGYLPRDSTIWGKGKIILTTCDSVNNMSGAVIEVSELDHKEKIQLYSKILSHQGNVSKEEQHFLDSLPPYPLDISTAAYYLKTVSISSQEYLSRMRENSMQFSEAQTDILKDVGNYTKTRFNIIGLSVKNLLAEDQDFFDLLLLLSVIDAKNIPREILDFYKNPVTVDKFLHALQKHFLLSCCGKTISLHSATQTVVRSYLLQMLKTMKQQNKMENITESIEKYADKLLVEQDLQSLQLLLPHLLVLVSHANILNKIALANLNVKIANIDIIKQVNQNQSKILLENSLVIYKKHYPNAHPKVAWVLGQLGVLSKSDIERQRKFFEESLDKYQKYYQKENPVQCVWILVHLGNFYRRLGDYHKAEHYLQKSLEIYQEHYGSEHPKTAWVLANMGRFYRRIGDYKKAKFLFEESLDIHSKYPGKNEIEVAWVTLNLGILYYYLWDLNQSKHLIDKGVEVYKIYYTSQNREMGWALIYKALTTASITGDWLTAEAVVKEYADIFIENGEKDHVSVSWALERLVRVYINLHEYSKALSILDKMLKTYTKLAGENSVQVGFCKNYIGRINSLMGNYKIAEYFLKDAFVILNQNHHPRNYIVIKSLINNYKLQGYCNSFILKSYETMFEKTVRQYFPSDSGMIAILNLFDVESVTNKASILPSLKFFDT